MKLKLNGKIYQGKEIKREVKSEGHSTRQELVRANTQTYVVIPCWFRHDIITFRTAENEDVIYHEIFRDDKLNDRYIDHDYYKTTEEYKKEFASFINSW